MKDIAPSESSGLFPGGHLQIILDNMLDMICQVDIDGIYQYLSPSYKSVLGYLPEELIGRSAFEFSHSDDTTRIVEAFNASISNRAPGKIEYRYRHKSGHYLWLESVGNLLFDDKGKIRGVIISTREITERKLAEESLKESEQRFRTSVETMLDGFAIFSAVRDDAGKIVDFKYEYINEAGCRLNLRSREEQIGHSMLELLPAHRETGLFDMYVKVVETGKPLIIEDQHYEDIYGGGKRLARSFDFQAFKLGDGFAATWRDATKRNQAEEELRDSKSLLEGVLDGIGDILAIQLPDHTIQRYNKAGYEFLGMNLEEVVGRKCYELMGWQKECDLCASHLALKSKKPEFIEKYIPESGVHLDCRSYPILDEKGDIKLIVEQLRDITSIKKAEDLLLKSELEKSAVLNGLKDVIVEYIDPQLNIIWTNKAMQEYLGRPSDKIRGMHCYEIFQGLSEPCPGCLAIKVIQTGQFQEGEVTTQDGNTWMVRSNPIKDKLDRISGIVNIVLNITERKLAEDALKESELRFRTMVEMAPDAIFIADSMGAFVEVNSAACNQLGYTREQLLEHHVYDIIPDALVPRALNHLQNMEDASQAYESSHIRADGTEVPVELNVRKIMFTGKPAMLGIARDITWRKQADEKLKASLQEKDVLLKEVHHRVKNNLQIIHSLLNIQANNIQDESAKEAIAECKNRVKSMALIHESLYMSENLARVDFTRYISSLTRSLFSSFGVDRRRIEMDLDLEPVFLSIDKAIPCGLIVNELVSNCLKHAFPKQGQGEVQVELRSRNKGRISIIIRDNGIGLMGPIEPHKAKTLGLRLVTDLVKQLKGEIQIDNRGGTEFKIMFHSEP